MIETLTENIKDALINDDLSIEQFNEMMSIIEESAVADSFRSFDEHLAKIKDILKQLKSSIPKNESEKKRFKKEIEKRQGALEYVVTQAQIDNKEMVPLTNDPNETSYVRADVLSKGGLSKGGSDKKYNESTELDRISDAIFEAYNDNKITKEQKNMLLSKLVEAYE